MKSKVIYLFIILAATMATSCKKDITVVANASVQDMLLEKINRIKDTKGGVNIISNETFSRSTKKMVASYQIDGSFESNPFDNVEVDNILLTPLQGVQPDIVSSQYIPSKVYSQEQNSGLFGRKVSVKYHKRGTSADLRTDISIETPPQLNLNIPGLGTSSSTFRSVPLTWTPGNSADNVYIIIVFLPESVSNADYSTYARVTRFISVPDNGSYTIQNSQFDGIPQGAQLAIGVARGNTALAVGMATGTAADRTFITAISSATLIGTIGGGGTGCGGDICIEPN